MKTDHAKSFSFRHYVNRSRLLRAAIPLMLLHLAAGLSLGAQTKLTWMPPVNSDGTTFTDFLGYKLYLGNISRAYTQSMDMGSATTYLLDNLSDGATYYFAVSDYDGSGNESDYSNEVSKTFPALYSLTAIAGPGGTIAPNGNGTATNGTTFITSITVARGETRSFTITPGSGYTITGVTVDGASVGAVTGYTFSAVTADHTLIAAFAVIPARINVALQANGGVATASSTYSAGYPVAATNNGDRLGVKWSAGGGWNDATNNAYPDWAQITFNGQKIIDEIDVFTLQDNFTAPVDPNPTTTFTKYGITAFDLQQWNGAEWVTLPGGSITGNNLVWRKITFPAITTDRIRVVVNGAIGGFSRITEIEVYSPGININSPPTVALTSPANGATFTAPAAITLTATAGDSDGTVDRVEFYYGATLLGTAAAPPYGYSWTGVVAGTYPLTAKAYDNLGAITDSVPVTVTVVAPAIRTNVALAANGGVATASSTYDAISYPVEAANNGDRKGVKWAAGGGWNDATNNVYPDWMQITFNGQKIIDEIDLFTLQDNYAAPVDPTQTTTFTKYGITAFDLQQWNGAEWVTLPGGSITGNNLVWRKITFPAITTDRIRVVVNDSLGGYSRITEIEVY